MVKPRRVNKYFNVIDGKGDRFFQLKFLDPSFYTVQKAFKIKPRRGEQIFQGGPNISIFGPEGMKIRGPVFHDSS